VGTTDYMAPEVIKGLDYDTRVDMWSLGVMMYVMMCGFPPWEGENDTDVFVNIMNVNYEFVSPEWDHITDVAKDFIAKLLQEHDTRMTAKQARRHPWIKKYRKSKIIFTLELPTATYDVQLLEKLVQVVSKELHALKEDVELEDKDGQKIARVSFIAKNQDKKLPPPISTASIIPRANSHASVPATVSSTVSTNNSRAPSSKKGTKNKEKEIHKEKEKEKEKEHHKEKELHKEKEKEPHKEKEKEYHKEKEKEYHKEKEKEHHKKHHDEDSSGKHYEDDLVDDREVKDNGFDVDDDDD